MNSLLNDFLVRFHNKAESLIIDIWVYSKDMFKFNLDNKKILSMFFNYRTPQVLFHFKAICYSDVLMTRFQNNSKIFNIKLFITNDKSAIFYRFFN